MNILHHRGREKRSPNRIRIVNQPSPPDTFDWDGVYERVAHALGYDTLNEKESKKQLK